MCSDEVDLSTELAFTETYKNHAGSPRGVREAACLAVQFPAALGPLSEDALLLFGSLEYPLVGFSPEASEGVGYYCNEQRLEGLLAGGSVAYEQREPAVRMLEFWKGEATKRKVRAAYDAELARWLPSDDYLHDSRVAFPLYRIAGPYLDFATLLRLGIGGLIREVDSLGRKSEPAKLPFYAATVSALRTVSECFRFYGRALLAYAERATDAGTREAARARSLSAMELSENPPSSFQDAVQLLWLYALVSGVWNYGRLDLLLGPLLDADFVGRRIERQDALAVVMALWKAIEARRNPFNGRVVLGGEAAKSVPGADAFAELAFEATERLAGTEPQLSFRFQQGDSLERPLELIGAGKTYPILYNDDVNVPAVMKAFGVSRELAEDYLPFGCGEYVIDHRSVGSPNGIINLTKALEATLHGGRDPLTGAQLVPAERPAGDFPNFESLFATYCRQVDFFVDLLARQERLEYDVVGSEAELLLVSVLFDECRERGCGLLSGGARMLGGTLESYGNVNCADSLTAIKGLVYRSGTVTLPELVSALDRDFAGYESLRAALHAAPKFGNDDMEADKMLARVHDHVCRSAIGAGKRHGLDSYLVVVINNSVNTVWGHTTAASADGRHSGAPLANAINPSSGSDTSGFTAFLNSLTVPDSGIHAGCVQNMKCSTNLVNGKRETFRELLETYFSAGGTQAMITVLDRGDLERALKDPEHYRNLMVRVGGFSARFVELPPDVQQEVLSRTIY